jgi:hypothetical protein
MIYPENFVFNEIAPILREKYTGISVSSVEVEVPASFPAVTIVEESNVVYSKMSTAQDVENAAVVMYAVNVYDNTSGLKKINVMDIFQTIDSLFGKIGFVRIRGGPVQNLEDTTIYRYNARYRGVAGKDLMIYTS